MSNRLLTVTLFLVLFFLSASIRSQTSSLSFGISNSSTSFPISGYPELFTETLHPGVSIQYNRAFREGVKNNWAFGVNLDGYYHQHIQSLYRIYPKAQFRRLLTKRFAVDIGLGAGMGLSFEGNNAFIQDTNGGYTTKSTLSIRPQWVAGLEWGGSYRLSKENSDGIALYFRFKSFLQGAYSAGYVPFLPLNSFELGVSAPLKNKTS